MFWIILGAIATWFFLKLLFNFILPVYRATKQVREQFSQMNQAKQQDPAQETPQQKRPAPKSDYIEFEEIK